MNSQRFGNLAVNALLFIAAIHAPPIAAETGNERPLNLVQIANDIKGEIVQIEVTIGQNKGIGSGFWINNNGYVATCWHVIKSNPNATITIKSAIDSHFDLEKKNLISANWEIYSAKLAAKDEKNDLALLKIDGTPPFNKPAKPLIKINDVSLSAHYKISKLNSELPKPGEKVLLAGYPLGRPYQVVQEGSVASIAHDLPEFADTVKILISTVANPGNSGGPLYDKNGKVIGVLVGGLPSRMNLDPAQAQSGIAVVIPAHFLMQLMSTVEY